MRRPFHTGWTGRTARKSGSGGSRDHAWGPRLGRCDSSSGTPDAADRLGLRQRRLLPHDAAPWLRTIPAHRSMTAPDGSTMLHPSFNDGHPSFRDARPSFKDGHPRFNDVHPSFDDAHPSFSDARRSFNDGHPSLDDARPSFEDRHPSLDDAHPRSMKATLAPRGSGRTERSPAQIEPGAPGLARVSASVERAPTNEKLAGPRSSNEHARSSLGLARTSDDLGKPLNDDELRGVDGTRTRGLRRDRPAL